MVNLDIFVVGVDHLVHDETNHKPYLGRFSPTKKFEIQLDYSVATKTKIGVITLLLHVAGKKG